MFTGAPKFHTGKPVLQQDEMAAIIKKNEWVFPDDKVVKGGGGGGNTSNLTISVPVNVEGGDKNLANRLRSVVEDAVRKEIKARS
jgi:hypothetical protein